METIAQIETMFETPYPNLTMKAMWRVNIEGNNCSIILNEPSGITRSKMGDHTIKKIYGEGENKKEKTINAINSFFARTVC